MVTRLHYSEILSVIDGRLVARSGMEGVYKAFDAIAGPGVTTLAMLHLHDRVKAEILRQHPGFGNIRVSEALDRVLANGIEILSNRMDAAVLPFCPAEYVEVKHFDEAASEEAIAGYGDFLNLKLKGKEVIAVSVSNHESN